MATTISRQISARTGETYWVVTWGKGMTQTFICLTEAEAIEYVKYGVRRNAARVTPLVSFRTQ